MKIQLWGRQHKKNEADDNINQHPNICIHMNKYLYIKPNIYNSLSFYICKTKWVFTLRKIVMLRYSKVLISVCEEQSFSVTRYMAVNQQCKYKLSVGFGDVQKSRTGNDIFAVLFLPFQRNRKL